jgi:succinate dehydrogenase / fumarate reductase, cytochrome b subunit
MAEAKESAARLRTNPRAARPLSPHISIFRPYINMTMSILHRVTGTANYFGSLLLAAWLISAVMGEEQFNAVSSFLASPVGLIVLFGLSWSVIHHMLGGIRHFVWDTLRGFELRNVRLLSWGTIFGSLTLTALLWFAALSHWETLL